MFARMSVIRPRTFQQTHVFRSRSPRRIPRRPPPASRVVHVVHLLPPLSRTNRRRCLRALRTPWPQAALPALHRRARSSGRYRAAAARRRCDSTNDSNLAARAAARLPAAVVALPSVTTTVTTFAVAAPARTTIRQTASLARAVAEAADRRTSSRAQAA